MVNTSQLYLRYPTPVLTKHDVCARYGIHERTLQRWIADGKFPYPFRPDAASHSPRWNLNDILIWEEEQKTYLTRTAVEKGGKP